MKTKLGARWHTWRKSLRTRTIGGITVGGRDARPDLPAHTPGVTQGNWPGRNGRQPGLRPKAGGLVASARRSTGIGALARNTPIPGAPNLSPP